jgi:hypothetical protein
MSVTAHRFVSYAPRIGDLIYIYYVGGCKELVRVSVDVLLKIQRDEIDSWSYASQILNNFVNI